MKIAINTRFLLKDKLEGIGQYTLELCKRLVHLHPDWEFHFLFDRPWDASFIFSNNVVPHKIGLPARHPLLWHKWFEYSVKQWIDQHKPDVFFSPDGFLSLSVSVPTILTVHDLAYEHFPAHVPFLVRKYYQTYFPKYAQKASKIIAVSEATKSDLIKLYQIDASKVQVVYHGVSDHFTPLDEQKKMQVKKVLTGGTDYFLYVGSINPRKNLNNLLKAYDQFRDITSKHIKLIFVGANGWKTNSFMRVWQSMKYKNDVECVGHKSGKALTDIYGSALALLYPSLYEGFGLPLLEAFQSEVPVITSNVSSLPEVAGDAAYLTDPHSIDDLARAMNHVLVPENRKALIDKGKRRVGDFSWDIAAEKVAELLKERLASPSH